MNNFTPLPKKDQLNKNTKKEQKTPFGMRKNKGDFGKNKNGIKPKKSTLKNHKKGIIKKRITTDEELRKLNLLNENKHLFRCFVCGGACEHLHHIKLYSSDKKDHSRLIPLCNFHHNGNELSPHGTAVKWRATFSIEEQNEASREMFEIVGDLSE